MTFISVKNKKCYAVTIYLQDFRVEKVTLCPLFNTKVFPHIYRGMQRTSPVPCHTLHKEINQESSIMGADIHSLRLCYILGSHSGRPSDEGFIRILE